MSEATTPAKGQESQVVIPQQAVRLLREPIQLGDPSRTTAPQLRVIRDGDQIVALELICPCGQCTRLRCLYEQ